MSLATVKFWTPDQVADRLQVTRRTVYRWLEEGRLPAYKAGKHWRIAEHDLDDFMRYAGRYASASVSEPFSDRELDAEISKTVLGYETLLTPEGWLQRQPDGKLKELPRYSTDATAANQLRTEVLQRKGWDVSAPAEEKPGRWFAYLFINNRHVCGAAGHTGELAVCRVVLKHYHLSMAEQLRASMRPMAAPSEVLIREDRDQR